MLCLLARVLLQLSTSLNNALVATAKLWAWLWMAANVVELFFSPSRGLWKTVALLTHFYIILFICIFLACKRSPPLSLNYSKQSDCSCPVYKVQEFHNVLNFHQNVGALVWSKMSDWTCSSGCCWWSVSSWTFSLWARIGTFPAWCV